MTKMTTEEAFVKVLQMHGIEHAFGIIGSAFMPICLWLLHKMVLELQAL
jgi:thiamine pyrophosphate-dependent acetolactate synthase large subunit-like protein